MKNLTTQLISAFFLFFGPLALSAQELLFEEINMAEEQNEINPLGAFQYRGKVAKLWKKSLKDCNQSKLINKQNAEYLGVSNRISIGDIMQSDFNTALRAFENLKLTEDETSNVINVGGWSTCERKLKRKLDINALLNAQFNTGDKSMDAELSSVIGGNKKVEFEVEGWQKNELYINDFIDVLKSKGKDSYMADLTNPNNIVMNREIRVKGFKAKITFDKTFSISLKDSLENGVEAKLNSLTGNLKLQLSGEKEIIITTDEEFVVFGKFSKIKN